MQKKIFKFFSIVSLIIIFFIVYEITDVSNKIINRSLISFDLNNIRNPQVKKTMRYLNDTFASIRILFSQKSKIYYNNNDELSGVHYDRMIAPLIKALQEQKAEIDALKTRITTLEGS